MSKDDPTAPEALRGKCLCGGFQFAISGPIGEVRLCHCDLADAPTAQPFLPTREFDLNGTV
jgi:hypothetical protein